MNAEEKVYHERFMREAISMVNRFLRGNASASQVAYSTIGRACARQR